MGALLAFGAGLGIGWLIWKGKRVTISGSHQLRGRRRRRR